MVSYTLSTITWEAEAGRFLNSGPDWSTQESQARQGCTVGPFQTRELLSFKPPTSKLKTQLLNCPTEHLC